MFRDWVSRLRQKLVVRRSGRTAPVHGAHGRPRDVDYVFKARRHARSRNRNYRVHLPPSYRRGRKLPVVMVLHGCEQTHEDIQRASNFDRLADRHGFIVVYPFITAYSFPRHTNCWGFWLRSETRRGAGEVEDLWQILADVKRRFRADASRLYVAGLSSGAGMAIAMLVTRCDSIAAGASVAGVPYSESAFVVGTKRPRFKSTDAVVASMDRQMGDRKRPVPLMIVHAQRDAVVNVEAARRTRNSWASAFDVDVSVAEGRQSGVTAGVRWVRESFGKDAKRSMIRTLTLQDDRHGWYGGGEAAFGIPDGPDLAAELWRFLSAHTLQSPVSMEKSATRRKSPRAGVAAEPRRAQSNGPKRARR